MAKTSPSLLPGRGRVVAAIARTGLASGLFAFALAVALPMLAPAPAAAAQAHGGDSAVDAGHSAGQSRSAESPQWEETRNKDGIRVFKRDLPDSKLLSFKGVGIIDAPIDVVLSVILDQDRLSEWAQDRSKSRVVEWINEPIEYVSYDRIELPWPLKDRDFVTRVKIQVDPRDSTTRVSYTSTPIKLAEVDDVVRGSLDGSYYVLEPVDGGRRTRATGVAVADPRGAIPAWIVNAYQRGWPYDTLIAIRAQAMKADLVVLPRLRPLYTTLRKQLSGASTAESRATAARVGAGSASATSPN